MAIILLLLFIGVPLVEIAVFIKVGGQIGLLATLAIVIATAVAGTAMLRLQGLATMVRVQRALERGEMPIYAVFDGFCLLLAGALLLTPGFVTDAIGGLLFVPAFRNLLRQLLARHLRIRGHRHNARQHDDTTINGEWEEVNEADGALPDVEKRGDRFRG